MEVVMKRAAFKEEIIKKDAQLMDDDEDNGEFGRENLITNQDIRRSSSPTNKDSSVSKQVPPAISRERSSMDSSTKPSPSNVKVVSISQEDRLEMTKAEMGEVREENERLKIVLARIVKDYQSLHMRFLDIVQQEQAKELPNETSTDPDDHIEDQELVSLSLGTSSSGQKKEEKLINVNKNNDSDERNGGGLTLGLECKFEGCSGDKNEVPAVMNLSSDNSFEEAKEVDAGETWPPSKILKNIRNGEDEVLQQPQVKKARVSVRARCEAPTMNDGCQWRKYGQKIAKGNPCPRAYYRCTVAPGCPVRKQVQRCVDDTSILITTYEGAHNHPLPISATAMASTTSAAASMLMSGSSASSPAIGSPAAASAATTTTLNGLKFSLSDPSRPKQFYLPATSLSSAPSYPTITLDLTAPPPLLPSASASSQPSFFNRFSSSFSPNPNPNPNPRFSSAGFNFSSSETNSTTALPTSWPNGFLSYASPPLYSKSPMGSLNLGSSKAQEFSYQSYMQKIANASPSAPNPAENSMTDTIAKAITADPSFQSALAAAITSYVGAHGPAQDGPGDGPAHELKWAQQSASASAYPGGPVGTSGCGPTYLTKSSSSSGSKPTHHGSLLFLQPTLGFSSSKSSSASPIENRENTN